MAINKPTLAIASAQTRKDVKILVVKVTGWDPLTQPYRFFRPPNPIRVEEVQAPLPSLCNEGYYPYVFAERTSGDGDGFAVNITIDSSGNLTWEIYSGGSQLYRAGDSITFTQSQLEEEGIVDVAEDAESFFIEGPTGLTPSFGDMWGISSDFDNSFRWFSTNDVDTFLSSLPIGSTVQFTTESGYTHRAVTTGVSTVLPGTTPNSRYISFANDPWPQELFDAFNNSESLTVGDTSAGSLVFNVINVEPPQAEDQAPQRLGQMLLFKEDPSTAGTLYVAIELNDVLQWKPVQTAFTAFDQRTGEQWDPLANFYNPLVPYQR